jgi:hypothetical protein
VCFLGRRWGRLARLARRLGHRGRESRVRGGEGRSVGRGRGGRVACLVGVEEVVV